MEIKFHSKLKKERLQKLPRKLKKKTLIYCENKKKKLI